jgi:membrane-associated phospholipid phosphatase
MNMYMTTALTYICFGALFVFMGWLMTRLLLRAGLPEWERKERRWMSKFLAIFTGALVMLSLFIDSDPTWITLVLVGFSIGVNGALVYNALYKRAHRAEPTVNEPSTPSAGRSV